MEHLLIFGAAIQVCEGLQSCVSLRLIVACHESHLVHLEHWLEQILAAVLHNALELSEAWVFLETAVPQVALIDLHWTSLITHHKLLERKEANIP